MGRKALYVTNPRARLQRLEGQVAVQVEGRTVERLAVEEIDRVLVFGSAQVTTQVLALMMAHGVPVSFFSGGGRYRGQVVAPDSGSVFVRLAQHRRHGEPGFRLELSRGLVVGKLRSGQRLLRQHRRNYPQQAEDMDQALEQLDAGLRKASEARAIESLLGVEGSAAAAYFRAFDRMVGAPFRFERRSQHPAHNAVNALLNLGYTLLANEVAGRLEGAGFDPRVGYYHGVRYGRISLALDLLEVNRVHIDRLTLSVLNRRMFVPDDFEERGGSEGVRLKPEALVRYVKVYETGLGEVAQGAGGVRERIREQVERLRGAVLRGDVSGSLTGVEDEAGGEG